MGTGWKVHGGQETDVDLVPKPNSRNFSMHLTAYLEQHRPSASRGAFSHLRHLPNILQKSYANWRGRQQVLRDTPSVQDLPEDLTQNNGDDITRQRSQPVNLTIFPASPIWNVHPTRIREKIRQRIHVPRLPLGHWHGPPSTYPIVDGVTILAGRTFLLNHCPTEYRASQAVVKHIAACDTGPRDVAVRTSR